MAFPESWLNELLAKNDIVSVVSSYVDLKPKGRRLWGLCPVHNEKTPSFSVSPDRQLYYCFGCHIGGTVIQFIMDVEHLTFPEAVEFLANRAGMAMPEEVNDAAMQRERAKRERLAEACRLAARFYMETLLGEEGGPGRAYLKKRGITSESVRRFGLGYAPDEWDALKNHLTGKGFSEDELLEAGLLVRNERANRTYDAYRNRLIFPIVATNGRVVGFGARVLNSAEKPKYINTGDTPLYNKRNNLYGLNLQKGGKLPDFVMVEGYTDVIGLFQAGVTNAVASLGTALTVQQAKLLKRYVGTVYIAYDGDAAGQNATIRGLDILSTEGLSVRVIVFPDEQDPDEFVRSRGRDAFEALKDNALSLNAFKLESMARGYALDTPDGREQYATAACRFISSLTPVERERYYQQLAHRTGYSLETLKAQGAAVKGGTGQGLSNPFERARTARRRADKTETERARAETALLYAMLHSKEASDRVASDPAFTGERDGLFSSEAYRTLAAATVSAYGRGEAPNAAVIAAGMSKEDAELVSAVLREEIELPEPVKAAEDCLRRIERCDLAGRIETIKQSLSEPQLTAEQRTEKLKDMEKLNLRMRGL